MANPRHAHTSHRIHQHIVDLLLLLVMAAQSMVKEIPLPCDLLLRREEMFPSRNGRLQSWFLRSRDDCMKMVGH
jgi:hypothetical protein